LTGLVPGLAGTEVAVALVLLIAVIASHLAGERGAGTMTIAATYAFAVSVAAVGVVAMVRCIGGCPPAPATGTAVGGGVGPGVIAAALAGGAAVLAGMDGLSNSVRQFRVPQREHAATALWRIALGAAAAFVAIATVAAATGVEAVDASRQAALIQSAWAVLGGPIPAAVVQAVLVAALLGAIVVTIADVPRFVAALAFDRLLPRHLTNRGDPLTTSSTVVMTGAGAALLVVLFRASVVPLVLCYVTAALGAQTLGQAGMARRAAGGGARAAAVTAALGAGFTLSLGVAALIVGLTAGTWLVAVAAAGAAGLLGWIRGHYRNVSIALRTGIAEPEIGEPEPVRRKHAVVLLDRVDESAARALSYARAIGAFSVEALGVPLRDADLERRWATLAGDVPMRVLQPADAPRTARVVHDALRGLAARHRPDTTTAIVPETLSRTWVDQIRHHRLALRVKRALLQSGDVVVADLTSPEGGPGPYAIEDPAEHHVVVLVSAVHRATLRALAYAESLGGTTLRALSVHATVPGGGELLGEWLDWGIDIPLELVEAPGGAASETVRDYLREFVPDGRRTIVTCVVPVLVVPRWYHWPLHNQAALLVRGALLFERGVVTTTVPYRLDQGSPPP
jgi:hypothetical protein